MTYVMLGRHVRVGDVVTFRGVAHRVESLKPCDDPRLRKTARIACTDAGAELVLFDHRSFDVATGPFLKREAAVA